MPNKASHAKRKVSPHSKKSTNLPVISTTDRRLRDMTSESMDAIAQWNQPPKLFVHGNQLARLRRLPNQVPSIDPITEPSLRGILARSANFRRRSKRTWVDAHPPIPVVKDILGLPRWDFPFLAGVVEVPVLRPDGSIQMMRGYDAVTKLFFAPPTGWSVPVVNSSPTKVAVLKATSRLREVISDFPFVDPASRTNCLGLLLTPVVRPVIHGPVPLALIDKPTPGTGASLLADIVAILATGRSASIIVAARTDDEWRKKITTLLFHGAAIVVIDNVDEALKAGSLAAALTASTWSDRLLGTNRMVTVPQRATWIATGNNLQIRGDLGRRSFWIRLNANVAQPWKKAEFTHPDLRKFVRNHRTQLLADVLTVVRGWYAAGQPTAKVPTVGGFDAWAQLVGSVLAFVGEEHFLGNLDELYDQVDEGASEWAAFLKGWWDRFGDKPITVAVLAEAISSEEDLQEIAPDDLGSSSFVTGPLPTKKIGKALARHADRVHGTYRLTRAGLDPHKGVMRWRVVRLDDGGFLDVAGFSSPELETKTKNPKGGGRKAAKPAKPAYEAMP